MEQEVKDWVKKIRYEFKYIDNLLVEYRLDETKVYDDLQQVELKLNKFILELKKLFEKE